MNYCGLESVLRRDQRRSALLEKERRDTRLGWSVFFFAVVFAMAVVVVGIRP